jgi:hypothetical protein
VDWPPAGTVFGEQNKLDNVLAVAPALLGLCCGSVLDPA